MKKKSILTEYTVVQGFEHLEEASQQLVLSAKEATSIAYAPYSNFLVGAALRLDDGSIIQGANFENASYPLCLCAERSAIAAARTINAKGIITSMAVTAISPKGELQFPVTPCGACRQVLSEVEQMQQQPIQLILFGQTTTYWILDEASHLLPLAFDGVCLK